MTAVVAPPSSVLEPLLARETDRFVRDHPASVAHADEARTSLLGGVPMSWMLRWASPVPLVLREARGAQVTAIDGRTYADLCLGDTGAMTGHAPEPLVRAISDRYARGQVDGGGRLAHSTLLVCNAQNPTHLVGLLA